MKKFYATLLMAFALVTSAMALPYDEAARQAYYLTDKMAYELNLTDYQYDRVYQINLDYFLKVRSEYDAYGYLWDYRNSCLAGVLYTHQYRKYNNVVYFYRPLRWVSGIVNFVIHDHYGHRYNYFCRPAAPPSYRGPHYGYYKGKPHDYRPDYRPGGGPDHRPGYGSGNGRPGGPGRNDGYNKPGNRGNDYRPQPGGSGRYGGGNDNNRPSGNNGGGYNGGNNNKPNGGGNTGDNYNGQGRRANINRGGR